MCSHHRYPLYRSTKSIKPHYAYLRVTKIVSLDISLMFGAKCWFFIVHHVTMIFSMCPDQCWSSCNLMYHICFLWFSSLRGAFLGSTLKLKVDYGSLNVNWLWNLQSLLTCSNVSWKWTLQFTKNRIFQDDFDILWILENPNVGKHSVLWVLIKLVSHIFHTIPCRTTHTFLVLFLSMFAWLLAYNTVIHTHTMIFITSLIKLNISYYIHLYI